MEVKMIRERNLTMNLLLTIFTCGLYGIVWFFTLSDDTGKVSEDISMYGMMALLLTLLTCGIYKIYWSYKVGKLLYEARENAGMHAIDNSILYLILSLFGLDIVNYCMMQSDLNELAVIE